MKTLSLYKSIDHTQAGHLYEHLYVIAVTKALREKGLFTLVDYYIDAKTYYDGFINIKVELYTKNAQDNQQIFLSTDIDLSSSNLKGVALQICAEKKVSISVFSSPDIISKLKEYNNDEWSQDERPNEPKQPKKAAPFFELQATSPRNFTKLTQKITLQSNRITQLDLELFKIISLAIRSNLQEDISDLVFCFTYKDTFKKRKGQIIDVNYYRIDKRQVTTLSKEIFVAKRLIKSMNNNGAFSRLVNYIQRSPDPLLANVTKKDIHIILKRTTVSFSLGLITKSFSINPPTSS